MLASSPLGEEAGPGGHRVGMGERVYLFQAPLRFSFHLPDSSCQDPCLQSCTICINLHTFTVQSPRCSWHLCEVGREKDPQGRSEGGWVGRAS